MDWNFIFFSALKVVGVIAVVMPLIAYSVMAERRISAWIQNRVGPNRVGYYGLLQPLADGLKFFFKEDFTPNYVRKIYFWLAPAITMIPAFLAFAVIPFGSMWGSQKMVIADLNVGILYTFGIASLGVYGIVLAGYASNSKYPFLGGIRSSAQMISYELAMGMSVIPVFLVVQDLNLGKVVEYQAQHGWLALPFMAKEQTLLSYCLWPVTALSFFIFMVAAFAETNRLPFDLPESETELVAGYHTEYSSMKFALFFLGEYANMIAASAMMVTLFFGGWSFPWFGFDQPATTLVMSLSHIAIFITKMLAFMILFIWVRWMLPRFRYDQLMDLGWRRFIPLALANVLLAAIIMWALSGAK